MRRNETSSRGRLALGFVIILATLAESGAALAYCRTSSCDQGTGAVCDPPGPFDCGKPVFWKNPCVQYSLQKDASKYVSLDVARAIFKSAFAAWTSADCGGKTVPRMSLVETEPVTCDAHEYNQKNTGKGNANVIVFRDDTWPYAGSSNTLALTTVTYNIDTGEIYDADMELNSADAEFTTGDSKVGFDLLSVATHEAGHFLGLSHSTTMSATMFPDYLQGDTSLRTLDPDDITAICTVYPPGDPIPATCDPTPRNGFSSQCAADQGEAEQGGCCTVAPGAESESAPFAVAAALGMMLLAARRRREETRS